MIALLPIGLLTLAQMRQSRAAAEDIQREAAIGQTVQQGLSEIRAVRALQVAAQVFALQIEAGAEDCQADAAHFLQLAYPVDYAAFVLNDGSVVCSSDAMPRNFSQKVAFDQFSKNPIPQIITDVTWLNPGQQYDVRISHPVRDPAGKVLGFALLSVDEDRLIALADHSQEGNPARALIGFTDDGEIVYATVGIQNARQFLPQDRALSTLAGPISSSFTAKSDTGETLIYAAVPVTLGISFLGVWPAPGQSLLWSERLLPYLLPALMWLTSVLVTLLGIERLVSRHIRHLSHDMQRFARGDRLGTASALDDPPAEILRLEHSYRQMTDTILRDEAELENLLRQQESLLREVHHRTGNSLQLIASILRMHRRETDDLGIRAVLDDLHNRVMSLSSVHFGLYRLAGGADVAVDHLMGEVVAKIDMISGRGGRRGGFEADLAPLILPAQQAVPLALLLAEILSCFPPAEDDGEPIGITLNSDGHHTLLEVNGPIAAKGRITGSKSDTPAVIGARLIRGFVTQLAGTMAVTGAGSRVVISISLQNRDLQSPPRLPPNAEADTGAAKPEPR